MKWLILLLILSGCVAPQVHVYKIVLVEGNKEKVTVTFQANSSTGVDATVDQTTELKDLLKLPVIP
tara:strand:- start:347 stop:544 length:198 start_codon:yes stop_codon:yes gene_type:complete